MPDIWELAAFLARFLLYLGVLASTGLVLVRIAFGRATDRLHGPISGQASVLALLGLLAAGFSFLLQGAALTGDASGMADPEMLGLLWHTPVGTRLVLAAAGLALVVGGLRVPGAGVWISAAGGFVALWSFSRTGHVAGADSFWLELLLLLHLAGIAFWIGILSPLRTLAGDVGSLADAAALGHRFGLIASVTVPILLAAGIVMAWRLVGGLSALVATAYGLTLLGKVAAVAVLLAAAAANRLRFVPAMRRGDRRAASLLRRSITLEWTAVCAILLITAALTGGPEPPFRGAP